MVKKNQVIKLSMSCKDGMLTINHTLDEKSKKTDVKVDPFILKFLNDEEYLDNLEIAASEYEEKIQNCLDLSPFPYVGFLMLKELRAEKLWCDLKCEEIVKILAEKNCVNPELINFVDESMGLMQIVDTRFDVIILNPFTELGDLDNEVVSNYEVYQHLLNDDGLLIPFKISLHGELINSEWLTNCCKITNKNVKSLKIDKFINKYSTQVHFDLDGHLECQRLTNEYKIAEISFENYHENVIKPFMRNNSSLPIEFIFLFFKIRFTRSSEEFSLYKRSKIGCFKRFAQILEAADINVDCSNLQIKFIQNFGLFRIKISCE